MQRIFGIAPLIIALILGTCFSSQAQIVTVTPVNIDGGFEMFKKHNPGVAIKSKGNQSEPDESLADDVLNTLQIPLLIGFNEYIILVYEVNYSIYRYRNGWQTDLKKGSYYAKFIGCSKDRELNLKISN
jgi:hypothetical protein